MGKRDKVSAVGSSVSNHQETTMIENTENTDNTETTETNVTFEEEIAPVEEVTPAVPDDECVPLPEKKLSEMTEDELNAAEVRCLEVFRGAKALIPALEAERAALVEQIDKQIASANAAVNTARLPLLDIKGERDRRTQQYYADLGVVTPPATRSAPAASATPPKMKDKPAHAEGDVTEDALKQLIRDAIIASGTRGCTQSELLEVVTATSKPRVIDTLLEEYQRGVYKVMMNRPPRQHRSKVFYLAD